MYEPDKPVCDICAKPGQFGIDLFPYSVPKLPERFFRPDDPNKDKTYRNAHTGECRDELYRKVRAWLSEGKAMQSLPEQVSAPEQPAEGVQSGVRNRVGEA